MSVVVVSGLLAAAAVGVAVPIGSRGRLIRLTRGRASLAERARSTARLVLARAEVSRRLAVGGAAAAAGTAAGLGYGPVAGAIAAAYAAAGMHLWLRRRAAVAARRALADALDGVVGMVGDLRAGVPPAAALATALPRLTGIGAKPGAAASIDDLAGHVDRTPRGRLLRRVVAAWRVAETVGAPLGDVLGRLDVEARSGERAEAMAAAHASGARATALLLAALPAAGVALGYGIGGDPLAVLLGTPVGGVCAIVAVALQLAGLFWTSRLARVDPERVGTGHVGPGRVATGRVGTGHVGAGRVATGRVGAGPVTPLGIRP